MGLSVLWILGVSRIKVTRDLKMEDLWSYESIHFRKSYLKGFARQMYKQKVTKLG